MIISKTPFRITFTGGGTDLRAFYQYEFGAVVNAAINKHVYIIVNKKFDDKIRVSYSKTEIVDNVEDIQHSVVREALKMAGIDRGIEIVSIADIPSEGTGLGSSSSFTVGLLHALYAFKGELKSREELARLACTLERDILKEAGGKQDQYAAALGGIHYMEFHPDESVRFLPAVLSNGEKEKLQSELILFYTGLVRSSTEIHKEQIQNTQAKLQHLREMKQLAVETRQAIHHDKDFAKIGRLLHEGWVKKKQLASGVSNSMIDTMYERGLAYGASGGKILGAGGGGFLMFQCAKERHEELKKAMHPLQHVPFEFDMQGTTIIKY
ncbi:kinase [Candidatus Woesearchaeota archaeon]|nr:kinase [Candidatus Woesearchaeota archaeon]